MNDSPLVSVIIPCYNYGHMINDALDSVLGQTYQNWECIVVDDGSIDKTKEVVLKYCLVDPRVKYIFQPNKGLAAARNTGLLNSKGAFIQFLDADDLLTSGKILRHATTLLESPEIDIVFGPAYSFNKELRNLQFSKKVVLNAKSISGEGVAIIDELIVDNMFLVHCSLFRSSIVEEIGYFNESMITCEDWNFWFRMALAGKRFEYLDQKEAEVYVRSHGINMSGNRRNMWIGKISFYEAALVLLNTTNSTDILRRKVSFYLNTCRMRYELAYGNISKGIIASMNSAVESGKLFPVLYDALYWVKQRILRRI